MTELNEIEMAMRAIGERYRAHCIAREAMMERAWRRAHFPVFLAKKKRFRWLARLLARCSRFHLEVYPIEPDGLRRMEAWGWGRLIEVIRA